MSNILPLIYWVSNYSFAAEIKYSNWKQHFLMTIVMKDPSVSKSYSGENSAYKVWGQILLSISLVVVVYVYMHEHACLYYIWTCLFIFICLFVNKIIFVFSDQHHALM